MRAGALSVLLTVVGPGTVPGTWEDLSICSVNGGRWADGHIDGWMDGWLEGRGGREERESGKFALKRAFMKRVLILQEHCL